MIKSIKAITRLGNYKMGFTSRLVFTKVHERLGICNICNDNMRCNFIDFSTSSLLEGFSMIVYSTINQSVFMYRKIVESCKQLQHMYNQGDYYIVQSYPRLSFHALCLDKITLAEDRQILMNTKYLDIMYGLTYTEQYRGYMPHTPDYKVLRVIEKYPDEQLKVIGIVKSNTNNKTKSRMHNVFLNKRYGIPMYPDILLDDSKVEDLHFDIYESLR